MTVLILGIGNPFRRDDGVGPWVAHRLAAAGWPAQEHSGEGAGLMDLWDGASHVAVVDALQSGATPGTVRRFDAVTQTLPSGLFRYSSHLFGLAEAIETARVLGRLPPVLIVYGVEGADFAFGEGLSPAVSAGAQAVLRIVMDEMPRIGEAGTPAAAG